MEPKVELALNKKLQDERDTSNSLYAPIIIKTIVYGFIGLICVAFVTLLTKLAWNF